MNYLWSSLTRSQLSKRFPLFYPSNEPSAIPISIPLLFRDAIHVYTCALVLRQLQIYRSTKNVYQGISTTCTALIVMAISFGIFTYACSCYNLPAKDSGRFGIFFVEHVNYMWVIANIVQSAKYVPQICLNWMGLCTKGVSSKYIFLSLFSEIAVGLGSALLLQGTEFYKKPYNFIPAFVSLSNVLCLSYMFYQAQYLYQGKKPYLPRGK
ncbi:hypothetical protein HG537_0H02920 [Torulaspora globosa]|uniref:Uncharacterized protein n=1 Tax=Torulaspora globosa TaxID=48254 RepID=A0A7H9HYN1_9SACH|nr:hypothetical protein HG537_0H02920 [Torulaspora sp. CBS 2947]